MDSRHSSPSRSVPKRGGREPDKDRGTSGWRVPGEREGARSTNRGGSREAGLNVVGDKEVTDRRQGKRPLELGWDVQGSGSGAGGWVQEEDLVMEDAEPKGDVDMDRSRALVLIPSGSEERGLAGEGLGTGLGNRVLPSNKRHKSALSPGASFGTNRQEPRGRPVREAGQNVPEESGSSSNDHSMPALSPASSHSGVARECKQPSLVAKLRGAHIVSTAGMTAEEVMKIPLNRWMEARVAAGEDLAHAGGKDITTGKARDLYDILADLEAEQEYYRTREETMARERGGIKQRGGNESQKAQERSAGAEDQPRREQ